MKKIIIYCFITFLAINLTAQKSDLSVLYVGINPDHNIQPKRDLHNFHFFKEAGQKRWKDFGDFLSDKFNKVDLVHYCNYNADLSNNYDVTIFDALPVPLKKRVRKTDENGNVTEFSYAVYLPIDFSAASITISTASPGIGHGSKLKLDWC